jgi:hypothetical protein
MALTKKIFSLLLLLVGFMSIAQAETHSEFFKETYEASRDQFLRNIEELKISVPNLKHQAHAISSQVTQGLFTDSLYLPPPSGKTDRLLVILSGTHGVEGYVGSALQNIFIQENFWQKRDENLGILLVHALNPYGFKLNRRVSESNVDLNRNFDTSAALFALKNDGYHLVASLLNPTARAGSGWIDRGIFYAKSLLAIAQHSMDSLRRAILKGQYDTPQGIYFGGKTFEPQKDMLEKILLEVAPGYKQVLFVDIHTGYGERGRLHLFADQDPALDDKYLSQVFAGLPLDYDSKEDFYKATGGIVVYGAKLFIDRARYAGIVFEFGTLDSQTTKGSLDSLYRMVRENQMHQHGFQSPESQEKIKNLFSDMFNPRDPIWQEAVAKQFREYLSKALDNQKAL